MTRREELEEKAIAHIITYQATLDREGWSDDRCVEILTTFAAKVERECWQRAEEKIEQLMENENESTDDQIWEYRDWCRAQKEGV